MITVDGTNFDDLKLYNAYGYDLADAQTKILDAYGVKPEIANEMTSGEHYIIIDNTELVHNNYGVAIADGNITVSGSYNTIGMAIDFFCDGFIDGVSSYALTADDSVSSSTDKTTLYTKEDLRDVLESVYNNDDQILVGHRLDPNHEYTGIKAEEDGMIMVSEYLEYFKDHTGQYPAMLYIDLSSDGFQIYNPESDADALFFNEQKTTDAEISQIMCELVEYCKNGGIVDFDTHFTNPALPVGEGDNQYGYPSWARYRGSIAGYMGEINSGAERTEIYEYFLYDSLTADQYNAAFKDLITDGTELNGNFKRELEVNARFFKALRDNGIAAIYRPFHEMNGNWFWWCAQQGPNSVAVDPQCIKELWQYVYDYYTGELGLDNLLWSYCPNVSGSSSILPMADFYPGSEYVDIVGVDWYTATETEKGYAIFYNSDGASSKWSYTDNDYLDLIALAEGKIGGAMSEFGPAGTLLKENNAGSTQNEVFNAMDSLTIIKNLINRGYNMSYIRFHGNKWSIMEMGDGEAFMNDALTLGLDESKTLFDSVMATN